MNNILVITPHAGRAIPTDIKKSNINNDAFSDMLYEIDEYTDKIYNFKSYFGNTQFNFPYLRSLIDVNEPIANFDDSVPLKTFFNRDIYSVPYTKAQRHYLAKKYHRRFHDSIIKHLNTHKPPIFILDGHASSLNEEGDTHSKFTSDFELSNYQRTKKDSGGQTISCSEKLLNIFAQELSKYYQNVKINTPYLTNTYGYIEEFYPKKMNVPVLCLEINKALYIDNGKLNNNSLIDINRKLAVVLKNTIMKLK
jgi:N-formylglutamate amidohydrolase